MKRRRALLGIITASFVAAPALGQNIVCPSGSTAMAIVLGNGQTRQLCMPDSAVRGIENAPPGTTPVVELAKCKCDYSPRLVEVLPWDLRNARCENASATPSDIAFLLQDSSVSGAGVTQLAVTGGTNIKGNRCIVSVNQTLLQEQERLTDGEVVACVKDLSVAADHLRVPNDCKL